MADYNDRRYSNDDNRDERNRQDRYNRDNDYGRSPYYGEGYNQQRSENDRDYSTYDNRHDRPSNRDRHGDDVNQRWDRSAGRRKYGDSFGSNRDDQPQDQYREGNEKRYSGGYDADFAERSYNRPNYGYGTDFTGGYGPGNYAERFEDTGYRGSVVASNLWEASVRTEQKHRGKGPKGYQRSENRIMEDVCDRLADDHYVDASDIEVQINGNEVVLTGTVSDRDQKRRAEDIVETVSGVQNVENRLRVGKRNNFNSGDDTDNMNRSATSDPDTMGQTSSTNAGSTGTDTANADNATTPTAARATGKKSATTKRK